MPLVLRSQKGSALTHAEMDFNFVYSSLSSIFDSILEFEDYIPALFDSITNDLISGVTPQVSLDAESVTVFSDGFMLGYIESDVLSDTQNYKISFSPLGAPFIVYGVKHGSIFVPPIEVSESILVDTRYECIATIYDNYDYFIFMFRLPDNGDFTISKVVVPD